VVEAPIATPVPRDRETDFASGGNGRNGGAAASESVPNEPVSGGDGDEMSPRRGWWQRLTGN